MARTAKVAKGRKAAGSGEEEVGRVAIARTLGVSEREVTNLVKAHPEFPSIVDGKARRFPLARCVQWYVRFKALEAVKRSKPAKSSDVGEMQKRRAEADMRMAEMDVADREARTVLTDHVDRVFGELADRMRATLVNIPGNFGLRLEELGIDPAKAEAVLSDIAEELIIALRGDAEDLEAMGDRAGEDDAGSEAGSDAGPESSGNAAAADTDATAAD